MGPKQAAAIFFWMSVLVSLSIIWYTVNTYTPAPRLAWFNNTALKVTESFILKPFTPKQVAKGESIFVVITVRDARFSLSKMEACAIEAAAYWNLDKDVFILAVPQLGQDVPVLSYKWASRELFFTLLEYSNVKFRHVYLEDLLDGTPGGALISKISESHHLQEHTKNAIMYTAMSVYGGTFIRSDVMLHTYIPDYNFIVAENMDHIVPLIAHFGEDEYGRSIAEECVLELTKTYDGKSLEENTSGLLRRVLQHWCRVDPVSKKLTKDCRGLSIITNHSDSLLPMRMFGNAEDNFRFSQTIEGPQFDDKTEEAFKDIARVNCPRIYATIQGKFRT